MAKAIGLGANKLTKQKIKHVTSIGRSVNSRAPTNKHKRKNWKKYRGQGN